MPDNFNTLETQIFRSLALAHPLEMYTAFPERFWEVFKELRPNCNREHMVWELERIGLRDDGEAGDGE